MENHEKIKLDKSQGIIILVYNYNKINRNNIPEIFFVIRHNGAGSSVKYMNSKYFDFSFCHDDPILLDDQISINNLRYNINDDTPINIDKILYAKKMKVDLFDPHSDFFNDICFKFTSENNTDVTLDSRIEDYYQNITLCNESLSSHYLGFNYSKTDKILTYRCAYGFYENEAEKNNYIDNIDSKINMIFSTSNIKVITCFSQLFNFKNLIHNYGGILCFSTFIIQIILYIHYCSKGTQPLQEKIFQLFESEKVVEEKNEPNQENIGNTDERLNKNSNFNNGNTNKKENIKIVNIKVEQKIKEKEKEKEGTVKNEQKTIEENKPKGTILKKRKKKKKKKKKTEKKNENPPKEEVSSIRDKSQVQLVVKDINENEIGNGNEENKDNKDNKDIKQNCTNKKEDNKEDAASEISQIYEYNNYDKNEFSYEKALKYDKRNLFQYYWFILKVSHIILRVFCNYEDYNLFSIKLGLLLMTFPINLTFNIFFFTNKNIKNTYINKIDDISTLYTNFINSFASSIFSAIFLIILSILCLTHNSIRSLRKIKDIELAKKKSIWVLRCIKLRICIYYILSLIFLLVFGYYIACFCSIFENTQIELIKVMFTSWALSLVYPFLIYFVSSIFRIIALRCKCILFYGINKILQMI